MNSLIETRYCTSFTLFRHHCAPKLNMLLIFVVSPWVMARGAWPRTDATNTPGMQRGLFAGFRLLPAFHPPANSRAKRAAQPAASIRRRRRARLHPQWSTRPLSGQCSMVFDSLLGGVSPNPSAECAFGPRRLKALFVWSAASRCRRPRGLVEPSSLKRSQRSNDKNAQTTSQIQAIATDREKAGAPQLHRARQRERTGRPRAERAGSGCETDRLAKPASAR